MITTFFSFSFLQYTSALWIANDLLLLVWGLHGDFTQGKEYSEPLFLRLAMHITYLPDVKSCVKARSCRTELNQTWLVREKSIMFLCYVRDVL
jgi:hypothetical protein